MLSSIMIGVGVDYTVHFLWRYRDERRGGRDAERAVRFALTTVGCGIVFNALAVVLGLFDAGVFEFLARAVLRVSGRGQHLRVHARGAGADAAARGVARSALCAASERGTPKPGEWVRSQHAVAICPGR
jgi:hypothetical protein